MKFISNDEFKDLPLRQVAIKLFGERKNKIKAYWANALIVNVFEKTIGY